MAWVSGIELARAFYEEAVRPAVEGAVPGLRYSAARIGRGSEVLGYDDEVSQDHDWGPRLELFLDDADRERHGRQLTEKLATVLPPMFAGFSTSFLLDPDGVGVLAPVAPGDAIAHRVEVHDLGAWCVSMLGFDPREGISSFDWLAVSSHRLGEVTSGTVFHDGLGELEPLRASLSYYPDAVWLFLLASQWVRISQEEAFVGRAAQVGDELGAMIVTSRLVRDVMRLCFIMERRYIPYSKWLGTAFARLDVAEEISPHLTAALRARDSDHRQRELGGAYEIVARRHNELRVTEPIDAQVRPFWTRGFPVILANWFVIGLRRHIKKTELASLPLVGSVDQFVDSTDVLAVASRARAAARALLQLEGEDRTVSEPTEH
jgi:hypothetical protein